MDKPFKHFDPEELGGVLLKYCSMAKPDFKYSNIDDNTMFLACHLSYLIKQTEEILELLHSAKKD